MASKDSEVGVSPTVLRVIDQCIASIRSDDLVQGDALSRLEALLRNPTVPKPDEIDKAVFAPFLDGDT